MTANLTDVSTWTDPIVTPLNSESPQASGTGSPGSVQTVREILQGFADRTRWLYNATQGAIVGLRRVEVGITGGVTVAGGQAVVGPKLLELDGLVATITPNTPARWLYLYVYDSAGTPTLLWSTTAPDAALVFKSDSVLHRYLCALHIYDQGGSTWKASPIVRNGDTTLYKIPNGAIGNLAGIIVKTITMDGTARLIDLSDAVPPEAKRVRARLRVGVNDTTAADYASLDAQHGSVASWTSGTGYSIASIKYVTLGGGAGAQDRVETSALLELDGSSKVWVEGNMAGTGVGYLLVDGWEE